MPLSLDDVMKIPDQPTLDHLTALGIVKPAQPEQPLIPPTTISNRMTPATAPQPVSAVKPMTPAVPHLTGDELLAREYQPGTGPGTDLGNELRHGNKFLNAENVGHVMPPMSPAATPAAPDMGLSPAPEASSVFGGGGTGAPTLGFKEQMALPKISDAVHPGTSQFYENELQREEAAKAHPWGTEENHPGLLGKIGHVLGRVGNTALDVLAPSTAALIPGTDLNKRVEEARTQRNLGEAQTRESQEAERAENIKNTESEIRKREGTTEQSLIQDAQGNVTGWKDKQGLHSLDDPNTPQSIKDIANNTTGKNIPEADQPIGVDVDSLNKQLENRYQVLHPGKPLPDEYKVPPNAKKGDFTRIDKALSATETAEATKTQRDTLNEMKKQTLALAGQKHDASQEAIEAAAKALAGGDLTRLKDIASMRGDQRLLIFNRAKELNPKFSPNTTDRMIKMIDEYTTGKVGDQLQSFGTFLEHAGAAKDAADSIYNSSVPAFNKPLNWWKEHLSGDANYQQFVTALEPVRKEFEGFLLGGRALYGDDRKNAEIILSENSSPAQINAALKQMGHTVQARYNELDHRFQNTIHKPISEVVGPISNEAKQGADKIGAKIGGVEAGAPVAEAPKPPEGKSTVYDLNGQPHFVFSNKVDDFLKDPKYKGWSANAPTKQ